MRSPRKKIVGWSVGPNDEHCCPAGAHSGQLGRGGEGDGRGAGPLDTCPPTMNEIEQEIWTLEGATWEELQTLVDLLNQALEATPDWVELWALHQAACTNMLHRACPACLEQLLVDGPHDPDPLIDDPHSVGEPTVMLRPPRKRGALYLPERSGILHRPGLVVVCETCADTQMVQPYDVALNDDHPLMGCSWRAAWAPCDQIVVTVRSGRGEVFCRAGRGRAGLSG